VKPFVAAVTTIAVALLVILGGAFGIAAFASTCASGYIDPQQASRLQPIKGYSGDQLAYAATILNTVTATGVDARAGAIAITAAMTRSQLRNLDTDGQLGLYGMTDIFGTAAERLSPETATRKFLATLTASNTWLTAAPAAAAAAAIPGTDDDYAANYADAAALTQALRATEASCSVGNDPIALAQELVDAANNGQLRGLVPDHIKEIRWIAQGRDVPNCGIDVRILQIMVIAIRNFDEVTVGDINRHCTGQIAGAGTASSHWLDGGGHAVDFAALNNRAINGADANSLRLINLLDPVVPQGARIGQVNCRAAYGSSVETQNFTQFSDYCNHLHVDVFFADNRAMGG
jgi:hypothetical protein